MIAIEKYLNKTVYIEIEQKTDDKDPEEEDKIQGGSIYQSLEEVLESANEGDEFIEITISRQFKAKNKCMDIVEMK